MVAAYLGFGKKEGSNKAQPTEQDVEAFIAESEKANLRF
jgi:hypothetical protein